MWVPVFHCFFRSVYQNTLFPIIFICIVHTRMVSWKENNSDLLDAYVVSYVILLFLFLFLFFYLESINLQNVSRDGQQFR